MEEPQSSNEFENFCKPKREYAKRKAKQEDRSQSHGSGSRRTRSQIAPDWSTKDAVILVNEVAAVEGDCKKALSKFQKWKIIADNCNAMGVSKTSNQYRRKWESMLVEYKKIKDCESQSSSTSYWCLDSETRNKFGLPENFSKELFTTIDVFLTAQGEQSDTDTDSDPEAEADMLDTIAELGPKKQKQQVMPQYGCSEEKFPKGHPEKAHSRNPIERRPQKSFVEETLPNISMEEKEKLMADKLREKAELIHALVKGTQVSNAENGASNFMNNENYRADFVKSQGDKLIECLGDIANSLNQLCDLVQECE